MTRIMMFTFGIVFLLCNMIYGQASNAIENSLQPVRPVEITLVPIMRDGIWAKTFTAIVQNNTSTEIAVIHPSCAWPGRKKEWNRSDLHGKSEILLQITKPDGIHIQLRDSYYHGFDPGARPCLHIMPGKSEKFFLGWFFQNARGRWENDQIAWKVFEKSGKYKVSILYRNIYPTAVWNDTEDSKMKVKRIFNAWTGEVESEQVMVEIE